MTTMHTEGLWHMRESATHATVTNARGDAVFHDDKRIPGVMADARLIAAAPDLLEALKDMTDLVQLMCPFDGPQQRKARAAIARATGEQP